MPSLRDHDQASLFSDLYCDADLVAPKFITSGEKVLVRERCRGTQDGIVDCHCFDLPDFIADAGGLDMGSKIITSTSPKIQERITVIPSECFDWSPDLIPGDIVGINLKDILSHKPTSRWGHYTLSEDVRIDLSALSRPVFAGKRVVLFCSYIDVVIEKLWWLRSKINLYETIASGGFYAVSGMNFSLFLHECPLGHLININKSLLFTKELSSLGVPVIPHVYAVNESQRKKWIAYLQGNPSVKTVVINTQLQRDRYSMTEVTRTVEALLDSTDTSIILNGFKPHSLQRGLGSRVFMANQRGLKRQAIIAKARGLSLSVSSVGSA